MTIPIEIFAFLDIYTDASKLANLHNIFILTVIIGFATSGLGKYAHSAGR